jgi:hypothetical protein
MEFIENRDIPVSKGNCAIMREFGRIVGYPTKYLLEIHNNTEYCPRRFGLKTHINDHTAFMVLVCWHGKEPHSTETCAFFMYHDGSLSYPRDLISEDIVSLKVDPTCVSEILESGGAATTLNGMIKCVVSTVLLSTLDFAMCEVDLLWKERIDITELFICRGAKE